MFLTSEQLEDMTGYRQPARQNQWLLLNNYSFKTRPDGRAKVLLDDLYARQLKNFTPGWRPDYSWLNKFPRLATTMPRVDARPGRRIARSQANPSTAARSAWRRAKRLKAVPPWAAFEATISYYEEAHRLTRETGVRHVVDHVIPLLGDSIRGLHVDSNLQVITEAENSRKSNRFEG